MLLPRRFFVSVNSVRSVRSDYPAQVQFPDSKGYTDDGYSQCPAPNAADVQKKFVDALPKGAFADLHRSKAEVFRVHMWGNKADMVRSSFEVLGLATLKYTSKGSREVCCIPMKLAEKILTAVHDKLEQPLPIASAGRCQLRILAECMQSQLGPAGLSLADKIDVVEAYRATVHAGSLMYIPSGYIFSERTVGGQLCLGWRMSCVESSHAADVVIPHLKSTAIGFGPKSVSTLAGILDEVGKLKVKPQHHAIAGGEGTGEASNIPAAQAATAAEVLDRASAVAGTTGLQQEHPAGAGDESAVAADASPAAGNGGGQREQLAHGPEQQPGLAGKQVKASSIQGLLRPEDDVLLSSVAPPAAKRKILSKSADAAAATSAAKAPRRVGHSRQTE